MTWKLASRATAAAHGGVTSFVINGNCAGTGGVFRLDRKDVLVFVAAQLKVVAP